VLVDHLRPGSQLVVISRGEPPLPVARRRAEGRLAELGPADLAMSPAEAGSLLSAVRVALPEGEVEELTRRAEGWPVALYLAALSPTEVEFLTRTAVLDRLSGPLCDAVLGTRRCCGPTCVATGRGRCGPTPNSP
jgi:LuxR family maltose regulon positive regulatory protein